jgi:hypothetical protein
MKKAWSSSLLVSHGRPPTKIFVRLVSPNLDRNCGVKFDDDAMDEDAAMLKLLFPSSPAKRGEEREREERGGGRDQRQREREEGSKEKETQDR